MAWESGSKAQPLFWLGLTLVLIGIAPLLCGVGAIAVASAAQCPQSDSVVQPCFFAGVDISGLLDMMSMSMILLALTFWLIPIGIIAWLGSALSWHRYRE